MSIIKEAIEDGLLLGFCENLAEECDGYDEPQDRCEMRPQDGCACLWVRYHKLPWWRRAFSTKPARPDCNAVIRTRIRLAAEDAVSEEIAARKRRAARKEPTT